MREAEVRKEEAEQEALEQAEAPQDEKIQGTGGQKKQKKQKKTGRELALMLGQNVKGGLDALLKMLHEVNEPTLKHDLKLDDSAELLRILLDRIERQDMTKYVKKTGPVTAIPQYKVVHVHDEAGVADMINIIGGVGLSPTQEAAEDGMRGHSTLYIDQEGWNLGRDGVLQLMQICLPDAGKVWLVHVSELGEATFNTPATETLQSLTMKAVLESSTIFKAFWDCRGDSDALCALYGIKLDPTAIIDLQLLDLATTDDHKRRKKVKGLGPALQTRLNIAHEEEKAWLQMKEAVKEVICWGLQPKEKQAKEVEWAGIVNKMLWSTVPEEKAKAEEDYDKGGVLLEDGWVAEEAWARNPMPDIMEKYAVGDVVVLPLLHQYFANHPRLTHERKQAVSQETEKRILDSQADAVVKTGNEAPEGWASTEWCELKGVSDGVVTRSEEVREQDTEKDTEEHTEKHT